MRATIRQLVRCYGKQDLWTQWTAMKYSERHRKRRPGARGRDRILRLRWRESRITGTVRCAEPWRRRKRPLGMAESLGAELAGVDEV